MTRSVWRASGAGSTGLRSIREDAVLIFALPRTGSTNLMRALNCHPALRICNEPFNSDSGSIEGLGPVGSAAALDAALERIWAEHNGIKHVWASGGWPFTTQRLNRRLLLRSAGRVIFLTRRNLLQQAVSNQLAWQTKFYNHWQGRARERPAEFSYRSLDEKQLRHCLRAWPRAAARFRRYLRPGIPHGHFLVYEDLFGPDRDLPARREGLQRVFEFLGLSLEDLGVDGRRIDELLDPGMAKVNSAEIYRRVPGIETIERKFGCDRTGWLFR
ncbi:MAG: hypothetical protein ACSLE2_01200 [Lysobacterales bacterium]